MNEFKAEVIGSGERYLATTPEPIASASLFKDLSDVIWDQRMDSHALHNTSYNTRLSTEFTPGRAMKCLDRMVGKHIDPYGILGGAGESLILKDADGNALPIDADRLYYPASIMVGTENRDPDGRVRKIPLDDEDKYIQFTEGHRDYHRSVYALLSSADSENHPFTIKYGIWRDETTQNQTSKLTTLIDHPYLSEDETPKNIGDFKLSERQEIRFLRCIQELGGISISPNVGKG
jgi:hypothetical protein